jgi:hypothetical protein
MEVTKIHHGKLRVEACRDVPEQLSGRGRDDDLVYVEEQIGDATPSLYTKREASDLDIAKPMVRM